MMPFELSTENLTVLCGLLTSAIVAIGVVAYRYSETLKEDEDEEEQKVFQKPEFDSSDPDIVIVGGGFTGSTLASVLGADGRRVVVIERDMTPPETFRGENMTMGGRLAFESLGLSHLLATVRGTRCDGFVYNDETLNVSAPCRLITTNGYMMRHGDLIRNLRKHAQGIDSVTYIEATGKDLIKENGRVVGVTYKLKDSEEIKSIRAPLTLVCDGFYSTFRKKFPSLAKPEEPLGCIGLELEGVKCKEDKHWLQAFLGNPLAGYFVYSIGEEAFRIMIEVEGKSPKDLTGFIRDTLAPTMPDMIKKPVLAALEKRKPQMIRVKKSSGSLSGIPRGVILVGDMLDTRDPISGSGLTAALRDIQFWREALRDIDLADDSAMMQQRKKFKHDRHSWAWAINTLSHVFINFALNKDVGTCRLRQQFVRSLKSIEMSGSKEDKKGIMDILNTANTDPVTLRTVLESTRTATIKHAFTSRPWTGIFTAIREAAAVYIKFNNICGPAFKSC